MNGLSIPLCCLATWTKLLLIMRGWALVCTRLLSRALWRSLRACELSSVLITALVSKPWFRFISLETATRSISTISRFLCINSRRWTAITLIIARSTHLLPHDGAELLPSLLHLLLLSQGLWIRRDSIHSVRGAGYISGHRTLLDSTENSCLVLNFYVDGIGSISALGILVLHVLPLSDRLALWIDVHVALDTTSRAVHGVIHHASFLHLLSNTVKSSSTWIGNGSLTGSVSIKWSGSIWNDRTTNYSEGRRILGLSCLLLLNNLTLLDRGGTCFHRTHTGILSVLLVGVGACITCWFFGIRIIRNGVLRHPRAELIASGLFVSSLVLVDDFDRLIIIIILLHNVLWNRTSRA